MKKLERQKIIRQLVQNYKIETQEDLSQRLLEKGITTTQATLSRDIRELGIIKNRYEAGSFYTFFDYEADSENNGLIRPARSLMATMSAYVISVSRAMFIIVVRTGLGEADLVADAIDTSGRSDVLGTIAGADTLLITCQDVESAENFEKEILNAIKD